MMSAPFIVITYSYVVILIAEGETASAMPVSNSSPLIHMSRLGKIRFAKELFPSVLVPPAVREEVIGAGKKEGYSDVAQLERLEKDGWLRTVPLSRSSGALAEELGEALGQAEGEAIALALEKKERLFVDDRKGRMSAELHGVETVTTLGLMLEMLLAGSLDRTEYRRNVKEYASEGWIGGEVIQEFLERGDELG